MNSLTSRKAGDSLIAGSVLITVTMVLHPVGGNLEHLLEISSMMIVTHSLAILLLPFLLFGFWGLTRRLHTDDGISFIAFIAITMGIFAGMLAAATNGLALPVFLEASRDAGREQIELIIKYSLALNMAMDYIFIGACCLSIFLWGFLITRKLIFPRWTGYLGMLLSISAIGSGFSGFVFTDLFGFRVFVFGLVVWIVVIGYLLRNSKTSEEP